MKKIVVVSDTHGNQAALGMIVDRERPFDCLIHCGDGIADLRSVAIPPGVTVVRVSGNMDRWSDAGIDDIEFIDAGASRIMIAHGDRFRVHEDYSLIAREGRLRNADAIVFGHTHTAYMGGGSPVLFNPGPAVKGRYGVIEADESLTFLHRELE